MEKPAVLFVAGSGSFGSGEVLLIEYLTPEKELPFHPLIVFPSPGPLVERSCEAGLESVVIKSRDYLTDFRNLLNQPFSWVFNLFSFIKISSIIRQRRVQLVVSLSFMNWTGALAARQEGVRHIWMIREILTSGRSRPRFFWGKWLAGRLANDLSGAVILESEAAASLFRRKRSRDKARVLLPGIDVESFRARLSESPGEDPGGRNLLVFWGSWNLKRFRQLVCFLKDGQNSWMRDKHPESRIEFYFPGLPPALVSRFLKILEQTGLEYESREEWDGLDPRRWKSAAAAIIIPGFDPLSRLVLEAGLARIPVLVAREIPEELFVCFRTGFVYDEERPEEMSALLEKLLEDRELRQKMGEEAEKHVIENFALERWKGEFEKLITENLG